MLRHLPPTAFPVSPTDISHGLHNRQTATTHFSEALQRYFKSGPCYLADSGRTALFLLLQSLREENNATKTEVILPAYTCPALVKVILDAHLQPVLVDISSERLTFNLEHLNSKLNQNTLAVIGVHPFGIPQDFSLLKRLVKDVNAVLIEDVAQSMGARFQNQFIGTQGDFGLFSLGPGKPLSTGGGGILSVNRPEYESGIANMWQKLNQAGWMGNAVALSRYSAFSLAFHPLGWGLATRLGLNKVGNHQASWGYALRKLTESQAGIGLSLLPKLDQINKQRQEKAEQLKLGLETLDWLHLPPVPSDATAIYLRFPLLVKDEARRETLYQALWQAGIGVGKMYERTLGQIFPALNTERYPGAETVARALLTLPTHHYVTAEDIARICEYANGE